MTLGAYKSSLLKNIRKHSVNSSLLLAPDLLEGVLSIVSLPLLLASVSLASYGKYQLALSFQMWFIAFTAPYTSIGARSAIANNQKGIFRAVFQHRTVLSVLTMFVGLLITTAVWLWSGDRELSHLMAVIFLHIPLAYLPNHLYTNYLIAKKDFKTKSAMRSIEILAVNTLPILAVVMTKDIFVYVIARLITVAVSSWLSFLVSSRKHKMFERGESGNNAQHVLRYGYKLIPSHVVNLSTGTIISLLISSFFGFQSLSIYQVASNLRQKFADLIKFIHPLLYADYSISQSKNGLEKLTKNMPFFFMISSAFTALTMLAGSVYILIFLDLAYHQAVSYFLILSLVFPASIITLILSVALEAQMKGSMIQKLTVASDGLKLALIVMMGLTLHTYGIAWAIVISGWLSLALYYQTLKRLLR